MSWHLPASADGLVITPESAGWTYAGLRVVRLAAGETQTFATGGDEYSILPLAGGPLTVEVEHHRFDVQGRESVFARVTDWCYVPIDAAVRIAAGPAGAEIALSSARATRRLDPAYLGAETIAIETRGAGPATRQVTNFMSPEAFDGADKLMCVELLTPDGNWSSYPPHRHDGEGDCPASNEEIYYFRVEGESGFALHRTYTADGEVDINVVVRGGDAFLIPRGYHGPCIAAPGYPLYYLNVLAGPAEQRTMAFCDDPAHHWVRDAWEGMPLDPRVPMTTAEGPTR